MSAAPLKILLLGKNGQVGWELQRALAALGEVSAIGSLEADFLKPRAVRELVLRRRPDVIVNAAAYTAVDKAESQPKEAQLVNAATPGLLAEAAASLRALLVHYSTDYVFDGSGDQPRDETAATGPLSVYGRTKLEGEQAIAASGAQHLILRTSWVYAARGGNFAKTMLRLAAERERLTVIDDQFGAPTGAELIADVTAHAMVQTLADPAKGGLYHLAAAGQTTWNGYARYVLEQAREAGVALKAGPEAVEPVPTTAFPTPATRPLNSRLDTRRLQAAFGLHLPPWQQGVARLLAEVIGPKA